jgi:hexokinase
MIWHFKKHHGQNALHGGPALKRASLSSIEQAIVTSSTAQRHTITSTKHPLPHPQATLLSLPLCLSKLAVRSRSLPPPSRSSSPAPELPFLKDARRKKRNTFFSRERPSPSTLVLGLLLVAVLLIQFLLPHLPIPYQDLFLRTYPTPEPTSCPPVPTYNPFVQDLYCRIPTHNPGSIYNRSPRSMSLANAAERVAAEFEYTKEDVNRGVTEFIRQMDEGLQKQGQTMSQIPTYVTAVPNGTEKGLYMAVDLGGTNFRVCSIQLHGNSTFSLTQSKVAIPHSLMVAKTSRELFAFLAKQIELFLKEHHEDHYNSHMERRQSVWGAPKDEEVFSLGFTFSFPVQQYGINKGTLIRWTKGFDIQDTIGKDVCAVGTLMARSYTSPGKTGTLLGAIFGTGTNGAYVEKLDKITKLKNMGADAGDVDDSTGEMIVNTEWGSFDNQLSVLPNTPYDHSLDAESNNPGVQMFEKRISGMFLGEILRRAIMTLHNDKSIPLFSDEDSSKNDMRSTTNFGPNSPLRKQWGLDTSFLSIASGDHSAGLKITRQTLDKDYGVSAASAEDAEAVRLIASAIGKRAARLSAVAIAAIIIGTDKLQHPQDIATTDDSAVNEDDVVDVGVDGSLVEFYPNFEEYIREALREVPQIGVWGEKRIRIGIAKDGSGVGAALIALVADKAMKGELSHI